MTILRLRVLTVGLSEKPKPGPTKDALVRKIRQLDTASHMHDWLKSPELRPPE
jgi:hypothetical protein